MSGPILQVAGPRAKPAWVTAGRAPGALSALAGDAALRSAAKGSRVRLGLQGRGVTASRPGVSIPGGRNRSPESWFPGTAVRSH